MILNKCTDNRRRERLVSSMRNSGIKVYPRDGGSVGLDKNNGVETSRIVVNIQECSDDTFECEPFFLRPLWVGQ